jgi:hypothetical protein
MQLLRRRQRQEKPRRKFDANVLYQRFSSVDNARFVLKDDSEAIRSTNELGRSPFRRRV